MVTIQDFSSPILPTWCPGCGDFAIWTAIKQALVAEQIGPRDVLLCFDIGCNGNMADKIVSYVYKGLHGRVIPAAAGAALANNKLPVIAIAGDGGTFDEGIGHLAHAIRSDYDITLIVHNNCDFGLTTGQATPTTPQGIKMNGAPDGVKEKRLNPGQFILSLGASFFARGFTGNIPQLTSLIRAGLAHKGFSYIDTLQHCPTYNDFQDHTWLMNRVYDANANTDPAVNNTAAVVPTRTRAEAYSLVDYADDKIATGIIFQEETPDYYGQLAQRQGVETTLKDEVKLYDVAASLAKFS